MAERPKELIKEFPCTKCAACCKQVRGLMPTKKDGSCVYLKEDRCSIYEDRPDICRINDGYEAFKDSMTRGDDLNIDPSFKINLTQFNEE